jgi:hypothetical protein
VEQVGESEVAVPVLCQADKSVLAPRRREPCIHRGLDVNAVVRKPRSLGDWQRASLNVWAKVIAHQSAH